jgi:hypothetical protein
MALVHEKIRKPAGMTADGKPLTETVWTGRWVPPTTVEEWAEQRIAALGNLGTDTKPGRAVIALLQAGDAADVKAAGKDLHQVDRYAVLQTLRAIAAATEYPPGSALMRKLLKAWLARWGDKVPGQPVTQARVRVV